MNELLITKITYRIICNITLSKQIIISLFALVLGICLNYIFPISAFLIKSLLVLLILNFLIYAVRKYIISIDEIFIEISGDPILNAIKRRLNKKVNSLPIVLISVTVSLYFVSISIILKFTDFNLFGFFELGILLITVYVSIIGYMQYVYLVEFLVRISNSTFTNYSTFYPANTKWLILSSKLTNYCQNIFFITGSLYIILFSTFTPVNTLEILTSQSKDWIFFISLLLSWLIIIVAIVIAFPLTTIIKNNSIKVIIENMKYESIRKFESKITYNEPTVQLDYMGIIREIKKSDNYPFSKRNNLIIPYLTTSLNFITVVNSIFPNIKYLLEKI